MDNTKILNFGSLNIDYTYRVSKIAGAKETVTAGKLSVNCGGKGLNQSVAAARYGAEVYHAGKVGVDGIILKEKLIENSVDTSYVAESDSQSGHAIIQVDDAGQNCIIVYPGSNGEITENEINDVLSDFDSGAWLLLQNEINNIPYIIDKAYDIGMNIVFNPSPVTDGIESYPLDRVTYFVLNETEGLALSGETEPEAVIEKLHRRFPDAKILLTLGENGAMYFDGGSLIKQDIFRAETVDTTAAGDTMTGYFIAALADGTEPAKALRTAAAAAALTVSRPGASDSIPHIDEVKKML